MTPLPIDAALPDLIDALRRAGCAVLEAPPGAGKTTRVPLALLGAGLSEGRILMLEPRRLAARAAAERMAETLGEPVGRIVGYRVRGEARVSRETRIEVVTEGILTRMIQSDPGLAGIGAVIFDEFHERSLAADLGLALAWEVRTALRDDLLVVVMSATLDAAPVAHMLDDAPVVTASSRAFPVETRWRDRPLGDAGFETAAAAMVEDAFRTADGGILCFLPGEREIRRVEALLRDRLPAEARIMPLYGAMDFGAQAAAIRPLREGRKVVLATSIAETSLTIEDVRVVVDGGRARRARFDPGSGMSRLVTERVTRAEADQRRGRAGRVAPGMCFRLWTRGEEGALAAYPPAEIESGDLAGLALELALWGAGTGEGLAFLTPPNPAALAEARALLQDLGALDAAGRATPHGKRLATFPLHPRLGHMLDRAGPQATTLAALLADRDPLRGAPSDLSLRLEALADPRRSEAAHPWQLHRGTVERIRTEARRLAPLARRTAQGASPFEREALSPAAMASLAYPDRIALRRDGSEPRYLMTGGKGAVMSRDDPLADARLIVATDLDGDPREARIRQAAVLSEAELRALHGERIAWREVCAWSRREGRVLARRQEILGACVLGDRPWPDAPAEALARAAADGLRALGLDALRWSDPARRLRDRVAMLRAEGEDLPDLSDVALAGSLEDWLGPFLGGCRTASDLAALDPLEPLRQFLGWEAEQRIERLAPSSFTTPLGRRVSIDYAGEAPSIEVRLQEMFGTARHPTVGPRQKPLRVTLLSPAGRPLQTTTDLPGFWTASYGEVRKEMRGRYPRHPWPEDPVSAEPTLRARPRGG